MAESHTVAMYCDLHGHSCRRNAFIYGWIPVAKKDPGDVCRSWQAKLIPHLMAKQNSYFSYKNSKFVIERGKESSARVAVYKQFDIVNSYTMETSFYGPSGTKY